MNRYSPMVVVGILLAGALVACGGNAVGSPSAASPATAPGGAGLGSAIQRSEGGQVTVEATWNGVSAGATFAVKLDTHSVDLDALDLSNAILRNDRGEKLTARPWAAQKGGHHREGVLTFVGDTAGFLAGARWIELALTGVGDIPQRTLRWEIGS